MLFSLKLIVFRSPIKPVHGLLITWPATIRMSPSTIQRAYCRVKLMWFFLSTIAEEIFTIPSSIVRVDGISVKHKVAFNQASDWFRTHNICRLRFYTAYWCCENRVDKLSLFQECCRDTKENLLHQRNKVGSRASTKNSDWNHTQNVTDLHIDRVEWHHDRSVMWSFRFQIKQDNEILEMKQSIRLKKQNLSWKVLKHHPTGDKCLSMLMHCRVVF